MGVRGWTAVAGAAVAAVLGVPPAVAARAGAAVDVLLSAGRPVTASSTVAGHPAGAALDGDAGTWWASAPVAGSQWLRVDLGAARPVTRVDVTWGPAGAAASPAAGAAAYRVQGSADDASWTDLAPPRTTGGTAALRGLRSTARYVRVLVTGALAGTAVRELRVRGAGGPGRLPPPYPGADGTGLADPGKEETALRIIATAQAGTADWRSLAAAVADLRDGRGYTAGVAGFATGTSDLRTVVAAYARRVPDAPLAAYLPALRAVDGSDSHAGLDPGFPAAWRGAAADPVFARVQEDERDRLFRDPALALARADGLRALGQAAYYAAAVVDGVSGLRRLRTAALRAAPAPAQGGDEPAYLAAFLDVLGGAGPAAGRAAAALRPVAAAANLDLTAPLTWTVDGRRYAAGG